MQVAPPAWSVQWCHVGIPPLHGSLRSAAVNATVLLALVLWSFPLAALFAVNAAAQRVDPDVLHQLHSWLAWAKVRRRKGGGGVEEGGVGEEGRGQHRNRPSSCCYVMHGE